VNASTQDLSSHPNMKKPKPEKRELSEIDLPRSLVFTTAMTCGVLTALVVQILLTRTGLDVVNLLQNLLSAKGLPLRTAAPWWVIALSAFFASAVAAALLSRFPPPWRGFRLPRWILGGAVVFALAHVGHSATAMPGVGIGVQVSASLVAFAVAVLMAMFGAYFTIRR
jgi:hypothetical protein